MLKGADVFIGVSAPGCVTTEMVKTMAKDPIIFACANPDAGNLRMMQRQAAQRSSPTGRSDFPEPDQQRACIPGIFPRTFDVRANDINDAMKIAAAHVRWLV